jgi:hypothetical protein
MIGLGGGVCSVWFLGSRSLVVEGWLGFFVFVGCFVFAD